MSKEGRRFKDAIYEQFARIGKSLARPRRLELYLLCQGPGTVDVLARQRRWRRHLMLASPSVGAAE